MTDRQAMLQDVLDNPADDAPRLIYADWLDENDEGERAEFIRLQCQYPKQTELQIIVSNFYGDEWREANQPYPTIGSRSPADRFRHLPGIASMFRDWTKFAVGSWLHYHRGFISHITCTAADWLNHGDAIVIEHPIETVTLTTLISEMSPPSEFHRHMTEVAILGWNTRWPRIKFTLPRRVAVDYSSGMAYTRSQTEPTAGWIT